MTSCELLPPEAEFVSRNWEQSYLRRPGRKVSERNFGLSILFCCSLGIVDAEYGKADRHLTRTVLVDLHAGILTGLILLYELSSIPPQPDGPHCFSLSFLFSKTSISLRRCLLMYILYFVDHSLSYYEGSSPPVRSTPRT